MPNTERPAPIWKRIIAGGLDFWTAFGALGYAIGWATGNLTGNGFRLQGWPAIALSVAIVAYFYLGRYHLGGTLWDRAFGIRRP